MYNHKEYVKQHRADNKEKYREYQRKYQGRIMGTEAYKARQARYKKRLREKVLLAYGNKCACCGEAEPLFLEIDHTNNDGAEHRQTIPRNRLYQWLKKHNFPAGFQILCCNCNRGKWLNGGVCPHKSNASTDET